jgi:putative endonuclease
MTQHQSGLIGERLALAYLEQNGWTVVLERYRCRHGEIDLIARDKSGLCFIEVKYRPDGRLGAGLASITPEKRRHLLITAQAYLKDHPQPYRIGCLEITRAGVLFYEDILHEQ